MNFIKYIICAKQTIHCGQIILARKCSWCQVIYSNGNSLFSSAHTSVHGLCRLDIRIWSASSISVGPGFKFIANLVLWCNAFLPNPLDGKLLMHWYLQLYVLINVTSYHNVLLPFGYTILTVVPLREHMNQVTTIYGY